MKITVIGGGPGGLYFSLLVKKAQPGWDVEVFEQNRPDDTFGFGVVFSDETLDEFLSRDPESYERIRDEFAYWDDVAIHYRGEEIRCAGNGFCGCSRKTLLRILQERCAEVGVRLTFSERIPPEEIETRFADRDVIVASDGINSAIREHWRDDFQPTVDFKNNRFCWMGSTRPMTEFNYFFRETEFGLVVAHTYQYERDRSTWVFEMDDRAWTGFGFSEFDEEDSKRKLEALFADELQGHPLILNRSMWRRFPRIFCERWWRGNVVILGDAKASAHYSIGSGTKLAMECGIALADAVLEHGEASVERAFQAYDDARRTPCQIIQHNADVSLAWFEHMNRSADMEPMQFATVVMCRAKSITYDNLIVRDEEFVRRADDEWYARYERETGVKLKGRPTPMFTPFRMRETVLPNRVVMSPMAQYMSRDGDLTDWHFQHYMSHALGGMGMIFAEMTCPSPEARITLGCPGLWTDGQEAQWTRIVDFVHAHTDTKFAMQLGHAGRKASTQLGWEEADRPIKQAELNWPLVSASALPWLEGESQTPAELDRAGMDKITADFVQATERAARAGFDHLELHCAHGYLLASFLSPLTNLRTDEYGGAVENRLRWPLEVFRAMRAAWPEERSMSVRISACDWKPGGITEDDTVAIARAFRDAGCDLIDVSAGQTVADQKPIYGRMFQTPFAEAIRNVTGMATMAVGAITEPAQVNTLLHTRRADLVALARPHLWNPAFAHQAAAWYGTRAAKPALPYLSGYAQMARELPKTREKQLELQRKAKPTRHARGETPAPRRLAAE